MKKKSQTSFDDAFFESLPLTPAVYFIWGEEKQLLYIGKAKNLRRRLLQYKNAKRYRKHKKMRELIKLAKAITWKEFDSHLEACLEEVRLIQKEQPTFNIQAKFSFLYPMIGYKISPTTFDWVYTTHPEHFEGFQFYGAFKSRQLTREAYFSLSLFFKLVLIPKSNSHKVRVQHSYQFSYQAPEINFLNFLHHFLLGEGPDFLEYITLLLLEKRSARQKSVEIKEKLKILKRFYHWEAKFLHQLIKKSNYPLYTIPQNVRDILIIQTRPEFNTSINL